MKPASAKAKGRRFQQEVRSALLARCPCLEPDDIKVAVMGESGEDVKLSPAARRALPFSFECKNVEKLNFWAAFDQAVKNAGGHTPVLVAKKNRTDALVVLRFSDFLNLI